MRFFIKLLCFCNLIFYVTMSNVDAQDTVLDNVLEEIQMPKDEENNFTPPSEIMIPKQNKVSLTSVESGQWVWPMDEYYAVICDYLGYPNHHAIDLYEAVGSAIYSSRDGVVEKVKSGCPSMESGQKECGGGYGNYVTVKHAPGVYSRYAHLDSVTVEVGQVVKGGQLLGHLGTSRGRVGTQHVHFEIRKNNLGMAYGRWSH